MYFEPGGVFIRDERPNKGRGSRGPAFVRSKSALLCTTILPVEASDGQLRSCGATKTHNFNCQNPWGRCDISTPTPATLFVTVAQLEFIRPSRLLLTHQNIELAQAMVDAHGERFRSQDSRAALS
jgi:hypothetical protein